MNSIDPDRTGEAALAETLAIASTAGAAMSPPSALRGTRPPILPRIEQDGSAIRLVHQEGERYRLETRLGAGGMGEAFKAEDADIGRSIAIKRLLPQATDATSVARFVEEVRVVGSLDHPNVVPVHDVGLDAEGRYFFVMKYLDGQTLEQIIDRLAAADPEALRAFTFERRVEIFLGVLHALEYAHARGVIHRDVKPSNVMVGSYGEVCLVDWGVAKRVTQRELAYTDEPRAESVRAQVRTTRHGALVGTPAYMAPEQARAQHDQVDTRTDLYAACVLFHELLTLQHYLTHRMGSLDQLLGAIATENASFFHLLKVTPGHNSPPAELVHFVRKGLEKDAAQRYQSASEMIAGLRGILEGHIRVQCHATFTKRLARELGRFVDRHPHLAFASLVAGVLAFVIFLIRFVVHVIA